MARNATPAPILRVHANPFASLDKDGYPAGQTRHDPLAGKKGQVHFIGAEVKRSLTPDEKLPAGANNKGRRNRVTGTGATDMRKPIFDVEVEHWLGVIPIADTEYHRRRLRKGELIAADEATARAAGVMVKTKSGLSFVPPVEALKKAREEAIAKWNVLYPGVPLPVAKWPDFAIPDASTPNPAAAASAALPSTTSSPTDNAPTGAGV